MLLKNRWLSAVIFSVMPVVMLASPSAVQLVTDYPKYAIIHFQLEAEQWVSTSTANVVVAVDASINQNQVSTIQQSINAGLQSIAKADWQIIDMQRNQDSSGLENIHVQAQARIATAAVAGVRTQADNLSKPGIKYTIVDTQFTPTQADLDAAKAKLRQNIYQQIATELKTVNDTYGDERYQVYQVQLQDGNNPQPLADNMMMARANVNTVAMVAAPQAAPNPAVDQKLTMNADVRLAAPMAVK